MVCRCSSICDAGYKTSISKLVELDDCIIVDNFNASSPLGHSKLPEDTRDNSIASELDLRNHVVLNEKANTGETDSYKSFPDISLASSTIAMIIDWRSEYPLGSDYLQIVLSIVHVITHSTQRTFIDFCKSYWARFKDDIELKLKK